MQNSYRRVRTLKRAAAWVIVLLMVFIGLPCAAESGFYCEYTPKAEKSSVFYIDLYSSDAIRAAVMELRFDDNIAEYREVSAVSDSASVRAVCEDGCVRLAFADSKAVSGGLCRVAFKALQAGTCTFTLHVSQAADSEPKTLTGFSDVTLDVKLGKDDVAASAVSAKGSSSAASVKSGVSSRSSISVAYTGEDGTPAYGGFFDMRDHHHALTYILAGAGIVLAIGGLVFFGIWIGRRMGKNKDVVRNETENVPDSMEDIDYPTEDPWDDENPLE